MYRKYVIQNQRSVFEWRESEDRLDFKRNGKRLTKRMRGRVNDAVALLKGVGWLKPHRFEHETVQTFDVELERLERFIMENHHELMRRFGVRDTVVLIGARQWYELTSHMATRAYHISLADFQCGNRQSRLHGLSVVVLPWMEGTVLVPKEYMPIERELVPSGVMVTAETQRKLDEEAEDRRAAGLWNQFMGRDNK